MRTREVYIVAILIAVCGAAYAMGSKGGMEHPKAKPTTEQKAAVTQSVYVCPDCETLALKAGKCEKCGKEMVQKHVLGVKDGNAMVCDCPAGCACDSKTMKDGKCACGKEVKTMSCKGMYACACAGGKCCSAMSDKPGKCACGKDMKKSE